MLEGDWAVFAFLLFIHSFTHTFSSYLLKMTLLEVGESQVDKTVYHPQVQPNGRGMGQGNMGSIPTCSTDADGAPLWEGYSPKP